MSEHKVNDLHLDYNKNDRKKYGNDRRYLFLMKTRFTIGLFLLVLVDPTVLK